MDKTYTPRMSNFFPVSNGFLGPLLTGKITRKKTMWPVSRTEKTQIITRAQSQSNSAFAWDSVGHDLHAVDETYTPRVSNFFPVSNGFLGPLLTGKITRKKTMWPVSRTEKTQIITRAQSQSNSAFAWDSVGHDLSTKQTNMYQGYYSCMILVNLLTV